MMTKYLYRTDLPPYQRLSKSTEYTVYNHLFLKYPYSKVPIFTKMLIKSNKKLQKSTKQFGRKLGLHQFTKKIYIDF